MENTYTEVIGVRLTKEQHELVKKLAEDDDRTMSQFLRRLITKALKSLEETPQT
jgi:predicted DNA-binding protein